jgi:hypothetical protein
VSPNGSKIFVTGCSIGSATSGTDYATVAYHAATGVRLWLERYNGQGKADDSAIARKVHERAPSQGRAWGPSRLMPLYTDAEGSTTSRRGSLPDSSRQREG